MNRFTEKKLQEFRKKLGTREQWLEIPAQTPYAKRNQIDFYDELEQFIKEALGQQANETKDIICAAIKPVFESWATESRYVTGAWNTGEYIENDKHGDYWEEQRRTAWEQFAKQLDNKIAMKTIDKLKSEQVVNSPDEVVNKVVKSEQTLSTTQPTTVKSSVKQECNCLCHFKTKPTPEEYSGASYYGCSHCQKPEQLTCGCVCHKSYGYHPALYDFDALECTHCKPADKDVTHKPEWK